MPSDWNQTCHVCNKPITKLSDAVVSFMPLRAFKLFPYLHASCAKQLYQVESVDKAFLGLCISAAGLLFLSSISIFDIWVDGISKFPLPLAWLFFIISLILVPVIAIRLFYSFKLWLALLKEKKA